MVPDLPLFFCLFTTCTLLCTLLRPSDSALGPGDPPLGPGGRPHPPLAVRLRAGRGTSGRANAAPTRAAPRPRGHFSDSGQLSGEKCQGGGRAPPSEESRSRLPSSLGSGDGTTPWGRCLAITFSKQLVDRGSFWAGGAV